MEVPGPFRIVKVDGMARSGTAACGCALDDRGGAVEFTYCSTHQAAPELMQALETTIREVHDAVHMQGPGRGFRSPEVCPAITCKAACAVIAKASHNG